MDQPTTSVGHNQPLLLGNHEPNIPKLKLEKEKVRKRERDTHTERDYDMTYQREADTALYITIGVLDHPPLFC